MPDKETSQRSIWFFNSSAHMRLFTCSNFLSPARMLGSEWYWTGPDRTKLKCGTGPLRSILGRTVLSLIVSAGVCFDGKERWHFIPDKTKVKNAKLYVETLLPEPIQAILSFLKTSGLCESWWWTLRTYAKMN